MRRNRIFRTLGVMLLLFVMATAMYAFTAQNTVPDSNAGFGTGAIDGYTVSDITYDIDGNSITGVDFNLNPTVAGAFAASVNVAFLDGAGDPVGSATCTVASAAVECSATNVVLESVEQMEVAAAQ